MKVWVLGVDYGLNGFDIIEVSKLPIDVDKWIEENEDLYWKCYRITGFSGFEVFEKEIHTDCKEYVQNYYDNFEKNAQEESENAERSYMENRKIEIPLYTTAIGSELRQGLLHKALDNLKNGKK